METKLFFIQDAAYNFTKGLAQTMNIGKADPSNPEKMICDKTLDKRERNEPDPIMYPKKDENPNTKKCNDVIKKGEWDDEQANLQKGVIEKSLGDDLNDMGNEDAWYLRRCCAKTAKFSFV